MGRGTYLAVLVFIVVGSGWLEFGLRTRVLARWRRLIRAMLPGLALFIAWDLYAIANGHWSFDRSQISGFTLPGGIPVEEILFFMVVPFAAVLTLEAVRSVKGWPAGDEEAGR